MVATTSSAVIDEDVQASIAWLPFRRLAVENEIQSSWAIPIMGPSESGLVGVITAYFPVNSSPARDQLDLVGLYAGYAANAIERDRLLSEVTVRNRVLETVREMLDILAGPKVVAEALVIAAQILCRGLRADEVGLWELSYRDA
ncbi:multi-sensor signal transduction histidine kinase, partial [mine drainage metagenome]